MVKVCVWTLQCIDTVNIIAIVILMFFTEKKKDLDGVVKVLHLETQLSLMVVCLKEPSLLLIGLAENIFLRGKLE